MPANHGKIYKIIISIIFAHLISQLKLFMQSSFHNSQAVLVKTVNYKVLFRNNNYRKHESKVLYAISLPAVGSGPHSIAIAVNMLSEMHRLPPGLPHSLKSLSSPVQSGRNMVQRPIARENPYLVKTVDHYSCAQVSH